MFNMKKVTTALFGVGAAVFVVLTAEDCSSPEQAKQTVEKTVQNATGQKPAPNQKVNKASRLAIKRATDDAAAKADLLHPTATTVEAMLMLARPDDLASDISNPEFQSKRIGSFENTIWTVDAKITEIVLRADGDYYMVIEGASGARTVVEVPDPALCEGSKRLDEIKAVRKALEEKFHPTAQPQKLNMKAKITGFGFFGFARSKDGKPASNGARIMPGLKIDFK